MHNKLQGAAPDDFAAPGRATSGEGWPRWLAVGTQPPAEAARLELRSSSGRSRCRGLPSPARLAGRWAAGNRGGQRWREGACAQTRGPSLRPRLSNPEPAKRKTWNREGESCPVAEQSRAENSPGFPVRSRKSRPRDSNALRSDPCSHQARPSSHLYLQRPGSLNGRHK